MANIASSDVSYSIGPKDIHKMEDGRKMVHATMAFGDGVLDYVAGGVPLDKGKLGCPYNIDSFVIDDNGGSGYSFVFDKANLKLKMYAGAPDAHTHSVPAHAHDLLIKGGQAAAGTAAVAYYATDILGKEAVTDKTILGADSATKGGVIQVGADVSGSTTPGSVALNELSGAFALQTLKVTVIGY